MKAKVGVESPHSPAAFSKFYAEYTAYPPPILDSRAFNVSRRPRSGLEKQSLFEDSLFGFTEALIGEGHFNLRDRA